MYTIYMIRVGGAPRYVGLVLTSNGRSRANAHGLRFGKDSTWETLLTCETREDARWWEREAIQRLKAAGADLENRNCLNHERKPFSPRAVPVPYAEKRDWQTIPRRLR
jgi:hypothetical protein